MNRRTRLPGRGSVPIHPLALAAYPALFLYAENLREMIPPQELLLPLLVSVAGAAGLLIVLRMTLGTLSSAAFPAVRGPGWRRGPLAQMVSGSRPKARVRTTSALIHGPAPWAEPVTVSRPAR